MSNDYSQPIELKDEDDLLKHGLLNDSSIQYGISGIQNIDMNDNLDMLGPSDRIL
mgnify:CR=1 FL=1